MPYCCQCGTAVPDAARFCGKCGAAQPLAGGPVTPGDPFASLTPRTAAILCYVPFLGWVMSIIVLASRRFREDRLIRFHAFQGLYLFVAWLLVQWFLGDFLGFLPGRHGIEGTALALVKLAVVGAGVFMIIKTSQDQPYHLPVLGELAEKSVLEQS